MNEVMIFQYSSAREFLVAVLAEKQVRNPKFSIRAWSKQVGHRNPSILSRILRGERSLKPELAMRVAETLKLTGKPRRYFDLLVLLENAKGHSEKELYSQLLAQLKPDRQFSTLTLDHFRYVADWYHLAILEMTLLKGFKSDPEWIARRLGKPMTAVMVDAAIERMVRLELLERASDGTIRRKPETEVRVGNQAPSEAIRKHHSQMIQKGVEAMQTQSIDRRQILGSTIPLTREGFKKAQQILLQCHRELLALAAPGTGDEVYQLNTQFFSLTEGDGHEGR